MLWGIFTERVTSTGIDSEIPEIEEELGYKFDIVLAYTGLDGGFPTQFMEECYNEDRIVELTLQTTVSNNQDLYGPSPWLTLYRTGDDARIRAFARAAKAFGKPFLFRLNNEMNSDWVSYGGVTNLLDPDIYIANWRTVWRIFQEEGVDNAIWIFNPNDRNAPPNAWNCQAAYYPGNDTVQMLGVTGYNNGTYYQDVWVKAGASSRRSTTRCRRTRVRCSAISVDHHRVRIEFRRRR
jgi:beta-mannanase